MSWFTNFTGLFTGPSTSSPDEVEKARKELDNVKIECNECIAKVSAAENKLEGLTGALPGQKHVGGGRRRKSAKKSTNKRRRPAKKSLFNITKKWNPFAK
jgi:hypothetical protein